MISIACAQITLPASYKSRSKFKDDVSFLRYNFEEHKGDYIGKSLDVLYYAYKSGLIIKNVSTIETTPWLEEDYKPYVKGVTIDYTTLSDFLSGLESTSLYVYIDFDDKRVPDEDFWHSLPDTGIIAAFLERTAGWKISDIKVLKFQWK